MYIHKIPHLNAYLAAWRALPDLPAELIAPEFPRRDFYTQFDRTDLPARTFKLCPRACSGSVLLLG